MIQALLQRYEKKIERRKLEKRTAFGAFAGRIGLVYNLFLFVSKFMIGLLSGSVSIMADAINSLSDTISSVLTLVGFYIAGKPADKEHPYGHERFEYISGMLVSLVITFIGFEFLTTSVDRILHPESIKVTPILFAVLALSIGIKIWQGLFYKKVSAKIDSQALVASAKDSFNDVYTTLAVLVSAFIEGVTGLRIDGYIGFLIAAYIIYSGLQLIREFINELMGMRPSQTEIDEMKNVLSKMETIVGYHDLLIHNYGPSQTFASVHIEIDDRWDLNKAHQTIDAIEAKFKEELDVNLVCHIDPVNLYDPTQQFVHQTIKKIIRSFGASLKVHDIRLVTHGEEPKILFDLVLPTESKLSEFELGVEIQRQVYEKIGRYKVEITFDHTYLLQ
ncbi:cation diffusion facilitator family transporter [Enterococcus faecalis]|uniref:cation diffusion facilitator family transporter n=1 Tax=Enterococcus faecalis TaxID=1351 RepID=UPI00157178B7|nr:cation diffusion facilitator family transporter [Enterococcus faecalis]NSP48470.1 cation transporter [Enterococcus faecalis]